MTPEVSPPVIDQVTAAQRAKQEAHNDRIVATFNSVSFFLFDVRFCVISWKPASQPASRLNSNGLSGVKVHSF